MTIPRVVIIGSGFGGSVMACRLAESGRYRVWVLERGQRYGRGDFPRSPAALEAALWDPAAGRYGLYEHHRFAGASMEAFTASGLGGGSLIYSNVLYRMPAEFFHGWPGGLSRPRLEPHYDRVIDMLEARPYPFDREDWPYAATPKTRMLARAAERLEQAGPGGPSATWETPPLAVTFGPRPGEERRNRHGAMQTACDMCGQCNLGCNRSAKNSLDLTYLHRARAAGAQLRTDAEVHHILPREGGGYTVLFGDPRHPGQVRRLECERVIVAAGSIGSTRLLLRERQAGHLPRLSPALGRRWSPNGDLLALYFSRDLPAEPSRGPVITGAVRFSQGSYPDGFAHSVYVEDGGFPDFLGWYFAAKLRRLEPPHRRLASAFRRLAQLVTGGAGGGLASAATGFLADEGHRVRQVLPLLGMGRDRSSGTLRLGSRTPRLELEWDGRPDRLHFQRAREAMALLGEAIGQGTLLENPLSLFDHHVTVHPLGGCPMGDRIEDGVVDARTGEAFGHPGLYVIDGSIVPTSIGPNPSLTIAALAELYAEGF